jgi:hypothetical protein
MTIPNQPTLNGDASYGLTQVEQELTELAERDRLRIEAREPPASSAVVGASDFEQQAHTAMLESIDAVSQGWVEQLKRLRENTLALEKMVLQACAKAQHDVTELHLLGAQVMKEAARGEQVCVQLGKQLNNIMIETKVG